MAADTGEQPIVMGHSVSRRQFLRGDLSARRTPLRPPWALAEFEFVSQCECCDKCVEACESGIIQIDSHGFPALNFHNGECTFCVACVRACPSGALRIEADTQPWLLELVIDPTCMAMNGVVCRTCAEQCEQGAIHFFHLVGRGALPQVDAGACNGCGACVRPCPSAALSLRRRGTTN